MARTLTRSVLAAACAVWACSASTASAQDMIDLRTVVYHASLNVSSWPVTKRITGVDLRPGTSAQSDVGVRLTLNPYNPTINADPWPDFIMWPPNGDLRWTIWLFVRMDGVWHGAAVHEMWKDRSWTGAPLLTQYGDWIYPNPGSPWGVMGNYVPREGDEIGFMATSGDLRLRKDVLTVNQRSNVVTVRLTSTASYRFSSRQTKADFDGDGRTDISVFRPSDGHWYSRDSSTGNQSAIPWGWPTDIPVPGDYDGDGRADAAIFRPSTGFWHIRNSRNGWATSIQWGWSTDRPMPGDYNGDGRTDLAVYRPSTSTWYIYIPVTGTWNAIQWGWVGDTPITGDFDGDGRTDIAVYRPYNAGWYIRNSSTGAMTSALWGWSTDIPIPGDYDGDGRTDIALFRPSAKTFFVLASSTGGAASFVWSSGLSTDVPVVSDYDGDGRTDLALFRASTATWFIGYSGSQTGASFQFGQSTDVPLLKP
jgi:FG-GAP-like repeat